MNSAQCEALCEGSRDGDSDDKTKHCRFWRWVSQNDPKILPTGLSLHVILYLQEVHEPSSKSCTFMNGDQCKNYKYCGQKNCDCGDVGCPGEPGEDPQPPDDMKTCASGIEFHPSSDGLYIHWACMDTNSPYNEATPMPADTICWTTQA